MNQLLEKERYSFEDLIKVMNILRGENGCPWDREQTHESIKGDTLEEAYEVVEAINNKDISNLKEELGDLLLHVVFHSKIAEENKDFNISEVINDIVVKLIRRHPHVFNNEEAETSGQVLKRWDEIKKIEKQYTTYTEQLEGVPMAMPALTRAAKVQKRAAKVGFDFPDSTEAFMKLKEEFSELGEAILHNENEAVDEEFGDLLFSMVNISRFFGINPEISLTNATKKFINRFKGIEEIAQNKGFDLKKLSISEMDNLWKEVKRSGR